MYILLIIIRIILSAAALYMGIGFITRNERVFFYEYFADSDQFIGWIFIAAAIVLLLTIIISIIKHRSLKTKLHTKF